MSANTITIEGNLGQDPEMRYLESGSSVCEISIGFYNSKKNPSGWIKVTGWDGVAQGMATLRKGDRVIITGRLNYSEWQSNEGAKRNSVGITANTCVLSPRTDEAAMQQKQQQAPAQHAPLPNVEGNSEEPDFSDIPF